MKTSRPRKTPEQPTDRTEPVSVDHPRPAHVNGTPPVATEASPEESAGFWDIVGALTESLWQIHVVYVYRVEPAIKNAGDRNFIEKRTRGFDENDILEKHGSGKYLLILNNTKQRKTVAKISCSCYDINHPPRLRAAQLAPGADDEWREWIREVDAQRAITTGSNAPATATVKPEAPGGGEPSGSAVAAAINKLGDLSERILAQSTAPAGSGQQLDSSVVTLLTAMAAGRDQLAERLAERSAAPGAPPDPLAQLEKAAIVLEKLRPREKPEPAASPLEQIKQMGELVVALRDVFGAPATGAEPAGAWLPALIQQGPAILSQGANLVGNVVALARSWGAQPQGMREGTLSAPGTTAAGTQQMPHPAPATGLAGNDVSPAMQQYFQLIEAISSPMLNYLSQSLSGADFAQWFVDGYGALPFAAVKNAGKETLLSLFQMSALWPQLAPIEMQFSAFLDEFLAYDPNAQDTGDDDAQEASATTARVTPKAGRSAAA